MSNKPCPPGCTCKKHGCAPGCTCARHDARRPINHGTRSGYQRGCRCDACRTAQATYTRARRRVQLVSLKGNTCSDCGGEFEPRHLHFHHLDPTTKLFNLGNAADHSVEAVRTERAKCIVVCDPCHKLRHKELDAG